MSLLLFGKSALLGLAVAAPLGPIGALCIRRTLDRGFAAGVASGLGTALADSAYAALAAAGFAAFAAVLVLIARPLAIIGGLFLLWLGWKFFRAGPADAAQVTTGGDFVRTVSGTFLLTIANPTTILSFAAMFAGLGLAADVTPQRAMLVVAGVFLGSMAWWIFLSGAVAAARDRLPPGFSTWVGRGSGVLIMGFGLISIASAFPR